MNMLVTGATGFIGSFLCTRLQEEGWRVRGTLLSTEHTLSAGVEPTVIEPLGPDTGWQKALDGIDTVIHLAARVHVMSERAGDPLSEYRRVNVAGTEKLARDAVKAGVRRLVYISTIKVNGEEATKPYMSDSPPRPSDPYGISKWEAEKILRRIEAKTGMEVVVVRPTLVYGPGVKGNFLSMMKVVQSGIPLPLSSVTNKRSLIYVGNLVDALVACAKHPNAAGRTYLVSDGEDVSTPELLRRLALAFNKPARLFPVPPVLIRLTGAITGNGETINRLLGSLMVDSSKIKKELGWKPPFTMEHGLKETADWYISQVIGDR